MLSFTGIAVSGLFLRLKAKKLCSDPDFKASLGWYQNWKKRHAISFRTKTTLAQRLPQDLEEKTIQFHRFMIAARQRHGYSLSRIFNMDETPMRFELPSSRTVPVKSCEAEKRSFTVTLAVATDGSKLPPAVIFKGVRTPRDLAVPDSVRVSFHKKGWMDEKGKLLFRFFLYFKVCYTQITDFRNCRCLFNPGILLLISGVKEWIRTCLPRNPDNEWSLLVWDSFRAHFT